ASCRLSVVLALEIEMPSRQTKGAARNSPTDPQHEPGQSTLGRSPDSRRTPQARHRRRANLGRQIHGKAEATSISRLEDISLQPRRWDCVDRPVCGSDNLIPATVWFADSTARSTPY